jgi:hypothetical protein
MGCVALALILDIKKLKCKVNWILELQKELVRECVEIQ